MLVANVRSLLNKIDELTALSQNVDPSIMALSETWLKPDVPDSIVNVPGYDLFRQDRERRLGGGVAVFFRPELNVTPLCFDSHPDFFESLWFFLPLPQVLFVCLYIPPVPSVNRSPEIVNFLQQNIDRFLNQGIGNYLILCGDFNQLPLLTLCSNNDLSALVRQPTRGMNILDNILISEEISCLSSVTVESPIGSSDHNTVICTFKSDLQNCPVETKESRFLFDLRASHVQRFLDYLNEVNWNEFYVASYTVDEKARIFEETLQLCILETIPIKEIPLSNNDKPWITSLIKELITCRWKAFRSRDFAEYLRLKQKVKDEIKKAKLAWGRRARRTPKDLWNVVNKVGGLKRRKPLDCLIQKYASTARAANAINKALMSVFTQNQVSLPQPSCNAQCEKLYLSTEEVENELRRLKSGSAPGCDGIPTLLYKVSASILARPLAHLFNVSIQEAQFPSSWKHAHVVPVPKVRNPEETDLRPISLLPVPSKVFERLLARHVYSYFLSAFGPNQHGGRSGASTETALIVLHDRLTAMLECSDVCGAQLVTYDMTKAFDKLSHGVILNKLEYFHFPQFFINLMVSYLSDRTQSVKINNVISERVSVTSGVPQGSVLGPLLFNATCGDLQKVHSSTEMVKYVDDITICSPLFDSNYTLLVDENENILRWAQNNGLVINRKKCKTLVVKRKPCCKSVLLPEIETVSTFKILGVIWNDKLTWKSHVHHVSRIFAQRLYCLRVIKGFVSQRELFEVYTCVLRSVLEYCSPLFVGMPVGLSEDLEKLQRRAHKILCGMNCENQCLEALRSRRITRSFKLFNQSFDHASPLHRLTPSFSQRSGRIIVPFCKTNRRRASFFNFMSNLCNGFFQ